MQLDTGAVGTFVGFAEKLKRTLRETWGQDRFDFLINNAGTISPQLLREDDRRRDGHSLQRRLQGRLFPDTEAAAAHQRR
jgi:hypothetical protein